MKTQQITSADWKKRGGADAVSSGGQPAEFKRYVYKIKRGTTWI